MHVLDIGCGPGTITTDLAALMPRGHVTGLDRAPEVLAKARETAAKRGVTNIDFVVGDVQNLQFADGSFDLVHAHQVLQHVSDPVQAIREMRRVTKPGGIVACRDSDSFTWYPEIPGLRDWYDLYERVARSNGGDPEAGRRLHVWAHEAGFGWGDIKSSAGTWCYQNDEDRAWWSGLWADRTVNSAFAKMAVEGGHASAEELERIADVWRD
jgi:SAM-dependent methyltransferase